MKELIFEIGQIHSGQIWIMRFAIKLGNSVFCPKYSFLLEGSEIDFLSRSQIDPISFTN